MSCHADLPEILNLMENSSLCIGEAVEEYFKYNSFPEDSIALLVCEPHNFSPIIADLSSEPSKTSSDDFSQFLDDSICKLMLSKITFRSSGTVILQEQLLRVTFELLVRE